MCPLELVDSLPGDLDGLGHERRIPRGFLEEFLDLLVAGRAIRGNWSKEEFEAVVAGRQCDKFVVAYWVGILDHSCLGGKFSFSGHGGVDHALGEIGECLHLCSL